MEPITPGEVFQSLCVVPGPALAVAELAAYKTFFVDGAHMKDAQGETRFDCAQFLVIEAKTSLMERVEKDGTYVSKNLPLLVSICLSESKDEYAFGYWTLARAGLDLNNKEYNILHDRGTAVIAASEKALPQADTFHCDQHLFRNVCALPGIGDLSKARPAFLAMTKAVTAKTFDQARVDLCAQLPQHAVDYVMAIKKERISAYHFRLHTGKAISFTNTNPVEAENNRLLPARWAKTPIEGFFDLTKICGSTFASHQLLIKRQLEGITGPLPKILPVLKRRALGHYKMTAAAKLGCKLADANSKIVRVTTAASMADTVNVNLAQRTCDCGRYAEDQYPCVHALAAAAFLKYKSLDYFELFAPMFLTENIVAAHTRSILVPSRVNILPNSLERIEPSAHFVHTVRGPGRPLANKRIRSTGEL